MGAMLMLVGLAFLGVIAASLAAYFGFEGTESDDAVTAPEDDRHDALLAEIRALRAEVDRALARGDSSPDET